VTTAAILASTLVSALAAYAIARMRFRGRKTFLNSMIALMVVPPAVLILPLFILMVEIKLINTLQGLIIIYVGLLIPFSIYLLVSFFSGLPSELRRCGDRRLFELGILWRIVAPFSARVRHPRW
jgi:ABC-type glycerol-3-phosphate transport system permease component